MKEAKRYVHLHQLFSRGSTIVATTGYRPYFVLHIHLLQILWGRALMVNGFQVKSTSTFILHSKIIKGTCSSQRQVSVAMTSFVKGNSPREGDSPHVSYVFHDTPVAQIIDTSFWQAFCFTIDHGSSCRLFISSEPDVYGCWFAVYRKTQPR